MFGSFILLLLFKISNVLFIFILSYLFLTPPFCINGKSEVISMLDSVSERLNPMVDKSEFEFDCLTIFSNVDIRLLLLLLLLLLTIFCDVCFCCEFPMQL